MRDNPLVPAGTKAQYEMQWIINGQPKPTVELDNGQRSAQLECGQKGYKIGDEVRKHSDIHSS